MSQREPVPDQRTPTCEPGESLTLNIAARTRAMNALIDARVGRGHFCSEWMVDDACEICWADAAAVIRAAEGFRECQRCRGTGDVGAGAAVCCDECGGDGLEPISATPDEEQRS